MLHPARGAPVALPETAAAAEQNQLLQRLLSALAGALRLPLNRIQSWNHVLENELARTLTQESGRSAPVDPVPLAQHALAGIRNGIRDQLQLLDQLLDCSRAMSGMLSVERRPMLVVPAIETVLITARTQAAMRNIRVVSDYGDAVDARIAGDAVRLRQAVAELLANAIRFSPDQTSVRLILRREAGEVLITVADQGPGIRPDLLPHLFDWFQRGDTGRSGLGLGLALVRCYCELQGGEASAHSAGLGCGASFTLRFPEHGTTH